MYRQPLLIVSVCFALGIFFQDFFLLTLPQILLTASLGFIVLSTYFFKSFHFHRARPYLIGILFFIGGVGLHFLNSQKPALPALDHREEISFKITKKLSSNDKNRRYEILAWKKNVSFKSVLSLPKSLPHLDFNNYYQGEVYQNALEKPYSDFQFDYGRYLSRKGIYYQSYLPHTFKTAKRRDLSLAEKIKQQRLDILKKIDNTALQKRTREFTKSIILADRTELDQGMVRDFRDSGMMHILAISGTHMAIIFGFILFLLNLLFPSRYRRHMVIIALLMIWSFAIFIDFGNSVVRSCIMISTYYFSNLLQRKSDLLHSLSLAALIILILNSNQLFEVGFQLSFSAVFGIYWLNRAFLKFLPKPKSKFQNFMANIFSISMAAQVGTLPLVIYYFHQYSPVSIVSNLVLIPFAEIVIIFSLLMVIMIAFSYNFIWINIVYDQIITFTLEVIHFFAAAEDFMQRLIPLTLLEMFILYVIIYFLRFAVLRWNIRSAARVFYFGLLFIGLRLVLNHQARLNDEVFVHQFFKEKIVSLKNEDHVTFFISAKSDEEKIILYVISPYLTSRRTKSFAVRVVPQEISEVNIGGERYQFNTK